MSGLSEQDHPDSRSPMSYAPRALREKPDTRLAPPQQPPSEAGRPSEYRGMRTISPDGFDTRLEKSEAQRHPLDPEVIEEPAGLTRELRRMAVVSVAGRFAAAIGVSALVALFFVVMIPASRQPDGLSSSALIQSIKAALPQPAQQDDGAKPAPSELQSILASTQNIEPVTREQSEQLLQQFVQWRQKPAASQAP